VASSRRRRSSAIVGAVTVTHTRGLGTKQKSPFNLRLKRLGEIPLSLWPGQAIADTSTVVNQYHRNAVLHDPGVT
jgi:hypothetical protein